MPHFLIEKSIFYCVTSKINEGEWMAEIEYIQKKSGDTAESRNYTAFGPTEEIAIEALKEQINELFFIKNERISWQDIIVSFIKWVKAGGKIHIVLLRLLIIIIIGIISSLFLFDFHNGPLVNLKKNYEIFLGASKIEPSYDTGFLTEQFIASALRNTNSIFWASNVSFRNLQVGNKVNLENFLDKKKLFKLVLLDTSSVLADNDFIQTFSRTAKKQDITNTLNSLLNPVSGSLVKHGDKSNHQLYLSLYSPIIPMVRVDDSIYVSFPIHTDLSKKQSNYDGPYLKFPVTSKFGKILVEHFTNMINGKDSRIVYPNNQ